MHRPADRPLRVACLLAEWRGCLEADEREQAEHHALEGRQHARRLQG